MYRDCLVAQPLRLQEHRHRTGPLEGAGTRLARMIERDSDRGMWVCRLCPNAITPTNNDDGLCRSCWETLVLEEDGEVDHLV